MDTRKEKLSSNNINIIILIFALRTDFKKNADDKILWQECKYLVFCIT